LGFTSRLVWTIICQHERTATDGHEPGFREFHKYLSDPSPSEKKYQEAVEEMKTANRQYAKRQTSWIRNKLLPAVRASKSAEGGKSAEVYLLDATGLDYPYYPRPG
jgi:tRNA A37 N6-isopentenylltransferase MiaA